MAWRTIKQVGFMGIPAPCSSEEETKRGILSL